MGTGDFKNSSQGGSRRLLPFVVAASDLITILIATLLAAAFRLSLPWFSSANDLSENLQLSAALILASWLMLVMLFGGYRVGLFAAGTEEYRVVFNASVVTMAWVGIGCYLVQFPLSRAFFVLPFVVGIPALLLSRYVVRRVIQWAHRAGRLNQQVLIVATASQADEVAAVLSRESWLGYRVVGCATRSGQRSTTPGGIVVLGKVSDLSALVVEHQPDILFIGAGAFDSAAAMRTAAWELEEHPNLQIVVAPNLTDVASDRIRVRPVAGLPLVHLEAPRWRQASAWAKRLFDVVLTALLMVALAPLFALLAGWVKLHDGGPVLFRQVRVGRDGAEFQCFKFRSMVVDAEQHLAQVPTDLDNNHVLFKSKHDPRVSRPGRWMRRFSVDELPQLWNVLRGEMSLVGPRPPLPSEVEQYGVAMQRRLNVRPGLTGLWQVSGRSDLSWQDTVRLDLYYVDNWSMVQDLSILLRTLTAVLSGRGAY